MSRLDDWRNRRSSQGGAESAEVGAARPYSWGGDRDPSEAERALIREAAQAILLRQDPNQRAYRQMARGTLAALDWLEGRCDTAPSSGRTVRPDDVIPRRNGWKPTGFSLEKGDADDWGSGWVRPPTEDMHYHGAVWSLLGWWINPDREGGIAIDVPGLPGNPFDGPPFNA